MPLIFLRKILAHKHALSIHKLVAINTDNAKAQLFALLFTTGIFLWSLYLAIQIESGIEYELVGGGRPGITGIVLAIANLGVLKICVGFIFLLAIILFSLTKKLKSRSETEFLKR